MSRPVVEMRSIDKSFGPVRALVDVHLTLMPEKSSVSSATIRQASRRS